MNSARLRDVRHVFLDMDGTIYIGDTLFPTTLPFLELLREMDIGYTFLTNNSSHSVASYVRRLCRFGLTVGEQQVFTSTLYAISYLRRHFPAVNRIFVLGTAEVTAEFALAGYEPDEETPEAVVICFDRSLNYERLCRTAYLMKSGLPAIATHPDLICPDNRPTLLIDCGAICSCLTAATGGLRPVVLGKPDPGMLWAAAARAGVSANTALMVGDRLHTDILLARRAGALAAHITAEPEVETPIPAARQPHFRIRHLGELGELFRQSFSLNFS